MIFNDQESQREGGGGGGGQIYRTNLINMRQSEKLPFYFLIKEIPKSTLYSLGKTKRDGLLFKSNKKKNTVPFKIHEDTTPLMTYYNLTCQKKRGGVKRITQRDTKNI